MLLLSAALTNAGSAQEGTSNSDDFHRHLRAEIEAALTEGTPKNVAAPLGQPGGYNWIFLIQVAEYPQWRRQFTDMHRGVERFIDELVEDRRRWPKEQVKDTVSFIPYHFNLLGSPTARLLPLSDHLENPSPLKQQIPGNPLPDIYQGRVWKDGHDWRAALQATLEWMGRQSVVPKQTIIVVLDWNELSQPPSRLADDSLSKATSADLVVEGNHSKFASYQKALRDSGFDAAKGLVTKSVGNRLEADMAVFVPSGLTPFEVPPPPRQIPLALLLAALVIGALLIAAGLWFIFLREQKIRINDERTEGLNLTSKQRLDIIPEGGESSAPLRYVVGLKDMPNPPRETLASIKLDGLGRKIVVSEGALKVKPVDGLEETVGGFRLNGQYAEFELLWNNRRVGRVTLERRK